jgi:hypothetical protein
LKASRTTQADSLLALPGVRLTIDPSGLGPGALQWCGFDPQNTLQTGDGRTMHLRFLKVCAGPKATAEFEQPVVQTDSSGVLRLVLDSASLRLSRAEGSLAPVEGETAEVASFRLVADGVSLEVGHARVTRRGRDLAVLLLPGS